jgi:integrase
MQEFEPNKMDYVITEHEYLNTLIGIKKDREEVNGEYKKYRNERVKTDYVHYDYILKENIKIDAITSSEITELTLNQDIKRYHQIVIQEYGKVINSIIASHSDKYIFNKLMKDLEIPINNTNLKLDYLLKYRIQKYNKHLKEIANIMEIKPFTSHQARHSFAQLLVNNNTNLYYVQQAMGHGNLGSTKNYLNSLDTPHLDNITTNLGNMFN